MSEPLQAESWVVGVCQNPKCTAVHFHLLDERDEVIAIATIALADVPRVIEKIRDCAYSIATLKGQT